MQQANHNVSTLSSAVVMKEMNSGGAEVNNRRQSWGEKKTFFTTQTFPDQSRQMRSQWDNESTSWSSLGCSVLITCIVCIAVNVVLLYMNQKQSLSRPLWRFFQWDISQQGELASQKSLLQLQRHNNTQIRLQDTCPDYLYFILR